MADNECLICFEIVTRFVPVCIDINHKCCVDCYNRLINKN